MNKFHFINNGNKQIKINDNKKVLIDFNKNVAIGDIINIPGVEIDSNGKFIDKVFNCKVLISELKEDKITIIKNNHKAKYRRKLGFRGKKTLVQVII